MQHKPLQVFFVFITLLSLTFSVVGVAPASAAHLAATLSEETFMNSTASGWTLYDAACLTAGSTTGACATLPNNEGNGNGWLRLTSTAGDQRASAIYNTAFSSANGIQATFQYAAYGQRNGGAADGFAFYLIDGATTTPTTGGGGGALGYAFADTTQAGVTNGYLAVGFDVYQNFLISAGSDNACSSTGPGIKVAGSGSLAIGPANPARHAYDCLNHVLDPGLLTGSRAGARWVRITIAPYAASVTVETSPDQVNWTTKIAPFSLPSTQVPLPATFKMGFSGGSGWWSNFNEIRNLVVTGAQTSTTSVVCAPSPSTIGQSVTCTATVGGSAGTPTGTVDFYDGATLLQSGVVLVAGQATYTTSAFTLGSHTITANYGTDIVYGASSGNTTQQVNAAATETPTVTATPTETATETPTFTATPTDTATETPTVTATPTDTATATSTVTATPTETATATPTVTATPTETATATPTVTATPTETATETPTFTATPTETATATPTVTATPTETATATATNTSVPPTATRTPTVTATRTRTSTNTPARTSTPTRTATPTVQPCAIVVTNNADNGVGSLRQAIANVCAGGKITFSPSLSGQTISILAPALSLTKSLTIDGSSLASQVTIRGVRSFNVTAGTITLKALTFTGATASALVNNGGILTITDSTFSGNGAGATGGAAISNIGGTLNVYNSTFSGNSTTATGGAIGNVKASLVVVNSTFFNNRAVYGGSISNYGSLTVVNSTFRGNVASKIGNELYRGGGVIPVLRNTIMACSALVTDGGNNIDPGTSCGYGAAKGSKSNTDPKLGVLQNNGGKTKTISLLAGSPAIDAGNDATCAATDQRGVTRPQGSHCDIGAYEVIELVTNGGYNIYSGNTANTPKNWVSTRFTTADGKDTTNKVEGLASVKITGTQFNGVVKTLSQTIALDSLRGAAGNYNLSFWARGLSIINKGVCQVSLTFYSGSTLKLLKLLDCGTLNATFVEKSLTFTTTEAYTSVVVKITYSKNSGTVWFDKVSLTK